MLSHLVRRLLAVIPTLMGVAVVVFALIRLIPGDPAEVLLGGFATPERVAAVRRDLGLDRPLPVQFGVWAKELATGNLGRSIMSQAPVTQEIWSRFPATLELTLLSTCFALAVGISLGVVSATAHNTRLDLLLTVVSVLGMSMPIFWLGLMLLYVLGVWLMLLPISGRLDLAISLPRITGLVLVDSLIQGNWAALADGLKHLVLPAFTLSVIPIATVARMTRTSMVEVLRQDYISVARAKGLIERVVLGRHALKNALIPVITVAGTRFGMQLAGAVLVEVVYGWPGVGRLIFDAIQKRDYPIIQGAILFIACMFVLINLLTDLLYAVVDPRIRLE
ncbi:MAG TPA: ABC transporter permease [Candidatus Methylomirabilis sp.]|nr:ABC transporter permease [Candidatus Methylomirabilis sp.]